MIDRGRIRIALGTGTREAQWLILRRGLRLGATGIVGGTALALVGTRGMGALLFGVAPTNPVLLDVAAS